MAYSHDNKCPCTYCTEGRLSQNRKQFLFYGHTHSVEESQKPDLNGVIDRQLQELTASFEGHSIVEMPALSREYDRYIDAYASAVENCIHENNTELLYGREWLCDDCHKIIDRAEMKRARKRFGTWGFFQ